MPHPAHQYPPSLHGLEQILHHPPGPTFARSIHSNSSKASSVNKPLPPSPPLLKLPQHAHSVSVPVVENSRRSSYFTGQQEEIIDSYLDRDYQSVYSSDSRHPTPTPREEILPPRIYATENVARSLLSVAVPEVRLPTGVYENKSQYTSSDTMLAVRGAEDLSPESPRRTHQSHPYVAVQLRATNQYSGKGKAMLQVGKPPSATSAGKPLVSQTIFAQSEDYFENQYDHNERTRRSVSPLAPPLKAPQLLTLEGLLDWKPHANRDQSANLAALYQSTMIEAEYNPQEKLPMPFTGIDYSYQPSARIERVIDHSLMPKPLRASQLPLPQKGETSIDESDKRLSQFSFVGTKPDQAEEHTPLDSANSRPNLRILPKKYLQKSKAAMEACEEREQQRIISNAEKKYPAMVSPDSPGKRMSLSGTSRRSSVKAKFGDMYNSLAAISPIKTRLPSVSSKYPSTYTWTPVTPSFTNGPASFVPLTSDPPPISKHDSPTSPLITSDSGPFPLNLHRSTARRSRQRSPAIPLTPYQALGPKAWDIEDAKAKTSKRDMKRQSLGYSPQKTHSAKNSSDTHGPSPYESPKSPLNGQPWSPRPFIVRAGTSPAGFKKIMLPKTPTRMRPRAHTAADEDSQPRFSSWLGKRRAKKEEERSEKWREEMKRRIVVVGVGELGGVVNTGGTRDEHPGSGEKGEGGVWI